MNHTNRRGWNLLDAVVSTCIAALAFAIAMPALQMASADADVQTCTNNMKSLSRAFHEFADVRKAFPPRRTGLGGKLPYGGWGGQILPFLEPELAAKYNPDYDYYDPINQPVGREKVAAFVCPASPKERTLVVTASASASSRNTDRATVFSFEPGLNDYIASNGLRMPNSGYGINWPERVGGNEHQAMTDNANRPFHEISDGLSNTILIIEKAGLPDPWRAGRKTGDASPIGGENSRGAWAGFGSIVFSGCDRETGNERAKGDSSDCLVNCNNFFGIYGFHAEGANILLCDGSVRFVTPQLDGLTHGRLTIRDDGQPIDPSSFQFSAMIRCFPMTPNWRTRCMNLRPLYFAVAASLAWLTLSSVVCAQTPSTETPTAQQLAARVDELLHEFQNSEEIVPSRQSSDDEYLRRVYLDLVGRIPTVAETREFLASEDPDKRVQLASSLVRSGTHARHMATFWRRTWIPQADTPQFRDLTGEFETWLTLQLTGDVRYDEIVRKMLTVNIAADASNQHESKPIGQIVPESFLTASQRQPANLAANTTRAFLGLNLDCAQCHDHPFSRWTQEQFWETAAFFARPTSHADLTAEEFQIEIGETTEKVSATLFTNDVIPWPASLNADSGREAFAQWVTEKNNPYFAKNAVNRLWAHYFGVGLVEPLDDISEDNPALQPEILEELADVFTRSGFDLKLLSEAIVLTEAYQRTSRFSVGEESESDPHQYARMPVRGMSGEQLYASLRTASGMAVVRSDLESSDRRDSGERFTANFAVEDPAKAERSILQALELMNGGTIEEMIDTHRSPLLRVLANAPFLNDEQKINTLFLATLGRKPATEEVELFRSHLRQAEDRSEALGTMMWVLLNSAEFNTNH